MTWEPGLEAHSLRVSHRRPHRLRRPGPRGGPAAGGEMRSTNLRLTPTAHDDFLLTSPQPASLPVTEQFSRDDGGPRARTAPCVAPASRGLQGPGACISHTCWGWDGCQVRAPWAPSAQPPAAAFAGPASTSWSPRELRCPLRAHEHPSPQPPALWLPRSLISCVPPARTEGLCPLSPPETTASPQPRPVLVWDGSRVSLFNSPCAHGRVRICGVVGGAKLPEGGSVHVISVFQALASPRACAPGISLMDGSLLAWLPRAEQPDCGSGIRRSWEEQRAWG